MTPEQTAVYEKVYNDLRACGIEHVHADQTALGRAMGFEIPPPMVRKNGPRPDPDDLEPPPTGETMLDLVEREMIPITYLCEPWAPEGLNLIAGRPKLGKTTLMRQKQAAIAAGVPFWNSPCTQAKCVYLSLEEGDRLTRAKAEMAAFPREALANIEVFFRWPRGADGILQLQRLLDGRPDICHVGIDSLTKIRAPHDARTPAFQADYDAVNGLHEVAKARPGVAIDVIHHTRKMKSEDPVEDISGTFGLSAAVDSYWVMRHHEDGAVLHIGGRLWDRDANQYTLTRGAQRWELVGEFDPMTAIQRATYEMLKRSGGQSPSDGAREWGISRQSAMERFNSLVNMGRAYNKGGIYFAK
jgi:hypothetical protein